jgi:serine/threonine-protein kinase
VASKGRRNRAWASFFGRLRPTLLTRVALALALVGLLPAGLLAYRLIGVNREAMTDQVSATHALAARKTAERVGAFLETYRALADGLASNPALRDPLSQPARVLLGQNLQAWSGLGVLALAIVSPEGEQVILAQLADPEVKQRVAHVFGSPSDLDVAVHRGDGAPVIRLRSALPGDVGWIWLLADGDELVAVMDAFEIGDEAELTLADQDGRAMLGQLEDFPPDLREQAQSAWIQGAHDQFLVGGESFIGAFAPVPNANWAVLSRQPTRIARAAEARMRRQSTWALSLAAVLVGLLSVSAYRGLVQPIRGLVRAQQRLAGVAGTSGRGDEIRQLRESFEALERRLRERQALDEVFLGRYQVLSVVGSGAMGTVFRGWDPKLQRPVALKTIRLDAKLSAARRQDLISRLLDEAVMVARLNHQNVVSVYDVEDTETEAFVAMEFVDGESLEIVLQREGRFPSDQVVLLAAAIAHGLAAAHEQKLVHRDVKPANILLGRDGSIKVTDFGISELISDMAAREDVVFGTPGYLPPETLQGNGYRTSGDLFSLGAVMYVALTGRRPFEGRTVQEIIQRTVEGRFTPPADLAPGIAPELEKVVLELLEADPEKRPSDARQVANRLEAITAAGGLVWRLPGSLAVETAEPQAAPPPLDEMTVATFVTTHRLRSSRKS